MSIAADKLIGVVTWLPVKTATAALTTSTASGAAAFIISCRVAEESAPVGSTAARSGAAGTALFEAGAGDF